MSSLFFISYLIFFYSPFSIYFSTGVASWDGTDCNDDPSFYPVSGSGAGTYSPTGATSAFTGATSFISPVVPLL